MLWDENTPISVDNLNDMEQRIAQAILNMDNGKSIIAAAIAAMGQSASAGDTFAQLEQKIRDISKDADAAAGDVEAGKTFYQGGAKRTGTLALAGNATDGQVLTGRTYYNNNLKTRRTGTMPNRAGDTAALSHLMDGTTLKLLPSAGYRDGVDDFVTMANVFATLGSKRFDQGIATGYFAGSNYYKLKVSGLSFAPKFVIARGGFSNMSLIYPAGDTWSGIYTNQYPVWYSNGNQGTGQTTSHGTSSNQFRLLPDGFEIIIFLDQFGGGAAADQTWIAFE